MGRGLYVNPLEIPVFVFNFNIILSNSQYYKKNTCKANKRMHLVSVKHVGRLFKDFSFQNCLKRQCVTFGNQAI